VPDSPPPTDRHSSRDWSAFFIRHERLLTAYALSLTGHAHDAEDLIQSVLTRMIHKGVSSDVAPGYVLTAMRRTATDRFRRRRSVSTGRLVDAVYETEQPNHSADDQNSNLLMAFSSLPDDEAEVVMLRTLGELSLRDIASVIDKPLGTVASLHRRAINSMRSVLNRDYSAQEMSRGS